MADRFELTPLGKVVWEDRYALKDENGNPIEKDITETFRRVAKAIASNEKDPKKWEDEFYWMMVNRYFCPAGRILAHSGTHYSQLLNCFVLPFRSDSLEEIMHTASDMAIIQKHGGGTGFSYSTLRPEGSYIKGVNGRSCGVIGFISMMSTVSEVIEQGGCLTKDSLINTGEGLLYLSEMIPGTEPGWYDQNRCVKTKDGDKISNKFYVNGYSYVLQIETEDGRVIKGTPNHKIYVLSPSGYVWKKFDELNIGDWIVSKLGEHVGTPQKLCIDVQKSHHNCIIPGQLPTEIDEDFAFFLGYFLANGFSTKKEHDYRLGVTIPHNSYLNDQIEKILNDLFGDNISVFSLQKKDDQSKTYYISNRIVKEFMAMNGLLKEDSLSASIPLKIRQSPPEIVASYLAGLFEADGALSYGYPSYSTGSPTLARELQVLLMGLGIPCKISPQKRGPGSFSQNSMCRLRVQSFIGLKRWVDLVKVSGESRFSACGDHQPDLSREYNYVLPFAQLWLGKAIAHLDDQKYKSKDPAISRLRKRLKRNVGGKRALTLSSYEELKALEPIAGLLKDVDGYYFSPVTKIDNMEDYTYDMEVPETHSYIANSFISHNSRRGANLGLLDISHPDIWEFISYKTEHNWEHLREFVNVHDQKKWDEFTFENLYKWQMYNVSVGINDEFLEAVKSGYDWKLEWEGVEWKLYKVSFKKHLMDGSYITRYYEVTADSEKTALWKVKRKVPYPTANDVFEVFSVKNIKASELWDRLCYNSWADGCPGLINMSAVRKKHNLEYVNPILASNPCGEQPLPAFGSCNLASLVLPSFVNKKGDFDYPTLEKVIRIAVRFMDNVIDNCKFPLKEIEKTAKAERRIGMGTMGVHDLLMNFKKGYDTPEGRTLVEDILRFIRDTAYKASIELAKERGSFSAFNKSKFIESEFIQTLPEDITKDIYKTGIRHGSLLSQAPTGTIGAMYNVSTGCEPWFALVQQLNTRLGSYESGCPAYLVWKKEHPSEEKPSYFRTAGDISPENHVKMMIIFSAYMDSAVSKTVNMPSSATVEDIKRAYFLAMDNGVKGVTVFRDGCKRAVLINKEKDQENGKLDIRPKENVNPPDLDETERFETRTSPLVRGNRTVGGTSRIHMDNHNMYVTVNKNYDGQLVEIFVTVGTSKDVGRGIVIQTSGVENSWANAVSKITSLALRAGVKPESIIKNLKNIPSDKPTFVTICDGDSVELIPSPPHAVGRVIEEELRYTPQNIQIKDEDLNNIEGYCTLCGSTNITWRTHTCGRCNDCGNDDCGSLRRTN